MWIMVHSGSRGIGNKIGQYFIELAKGEMKKYFINLPDQDLAYLPEGSNYFHDYVDAVEWAQTYAFTNRQLMLAAVIEAVSKDIGKQLELAESAINCHHN